MPAAVAVRGVLAFSFFGSEALIPLGLSTQRGLPPSLVGLSLTAGALAWVTGSWTQDRAEAWAGGSLVARSVRVAAGLVLIALGIATSGIVILTPTLPVELVVAGWALGGLGMGVSYPGTTLTALDLAPAGQEGLAASALQVAETVGIATGTGAAGALFELATQMQHPMGDGIAWAFAMAVAVVLLGLIPALRLAPHAASAARLRAKPASSARSTGLP
jgi:MFS family permease